MSLITIRIITDSTCDLSIEDQERFDIEVIPLTVQFSGTSYLDGVDLSSEEFYDMLDACKELPTTSQVTPQTFEKAFKAHLDSGDEVVGIFISSEISGTFDSSCMAKETLGSDKVFVVDSRNATMGLAVLVIEAAKKRDAGFSAEQIATHISKLTKKVRFFAAVNTLKYLKKGGRISAASAAVGGVLNVKPIVTITDGSIFNYGKARGMNRAIKAILNYVLEDLPDLCYEVVFAHTCAPDLVQKEIELFREALGLTNWTTCSVGSVIGTYAGRGVVGFAYIAK